MHHWRKRHTLTSQAYYADRLCERGRIYLRDFLNGDDIVKDTLKDVKTDEEKRLKNIRDAIFKPAKTAVKDAGGDWPRKTVQEEVMELLHKDAVARLCKRAAMMEAEKVWNKHIGKTVGRRNPWKAALDGTMFWM
jgi:eukaryotic translation initiation factor 2C